jgi:hypothetical protein
MVEISNVKVYDLEESVIASRNAMRLTPPEYTEEEFQESLHRAMKLAKAKSGSGHDNWLKGVRVSFDIKYPGYFTPELQRYNFVDIVTSSSKMHRIMQMDFDVCCNKYVDEETKEHMKSLIVDYALATDTGDGQDQYEAFMRVVSNCPMGLELFMRCSTNYLQLKTIYHQRKNHRLKEDWIKAFCHDFISNLPYAKELIIGE